MAMARKALLIGSQTGKLSGVHNDIETMTAALERWRYYSTSCKAANSSRSGIHDAYDRLIADANEQESVDRPTAPSSSR
jgi:hypothetical protein